MTQRLRKADVRPARRGDLGEIADLCREHARYERASWTEYPREDRLAALLLDSDRAWCWVVEGAGELAGFATASLELSTWDAGRYLHLDCLYLREVYRGHGWGRLLVEEVARVAVQTGAVNLQWQTPQWNADGARFYKRLGATAKPKLRFVLDRDACCDLADETG